MQRRLWIAGLVVAGLLAAGGWWLRPAPVPVDVYPVQPGPLRELITVEGRTELRQRFTVSAPISGYLQRVQPEPGDSVVAGQSLFALEPMPAPALDPRARSQAEAAVEAAEARYRAALAELDNREADLRVAERGFGRQAQLFDQQLVSATAMDQATADRDRALAAVAAARARVDVARHDRETAALVLEVAEGSRDLDPGHGLSVTAPISGTVLSRNRCCEGVIQAGEPILVLGNLDQLEIRVDVLSADAVRVQPGMPVVIRGWGGPQPLEAVVRRVDPAGYTRVSALGVEEQRVPVYASLVSPRADWEGLGDGFRVEVDLILWQDPAVLQVPTSALYTLEGRWFVFRAVDGRALATAVEPGRQGEQHTRIVSGLTAGDRVIVYPDDRLETGTRVELRITPGTAADAGS